MLALKPWLKQHSISQAALAREVQLSPATIAQLLNKEIWPTTPGRDELMARITQVLQAKGLAATAAHFQPVAPAPTDAATDSPKEMDMLLRKQPLKQPARQHFGLFRCPFTDDVNDADDVFVTPAIRYIREAMWTTARQGGFIAIAAESGAGKSTLRRDLIDRIRREDAPVIVMEPYVLGMEDNDRTGKTLKAASIADAMISALAPLEKPRITMEAKGRQLHRLLKDSRKAGFSHVLIIEEAHGLSVPTLKHLKRFFELEDGFKKLLSIILIGQTELSQKLSDRNPAVREVVQRCELIELAPLDAQLEQYLAFKFHRVGKKLDEVFDKDACDGIRARLIFSRNTRGNRETVSLMYPLLINNLVTAALNSAAELGFERVSAELLREV
jgi:type II secretory pathway predicted ATPase ExeA